MRIATEQDFKRFLNKNKNSRDLRVTLARKVEGDVSPPMQIEFSAFDSIFEFQDFHNFKTRSLSSHPSEGPDAGPRFSMRPRDPGPLQAYQEQPKRAAELDCNLK